MPTFRTAPSSSLTGSIRRLIASGGGNLSPLLEMQADSAAATTARNMSLAEKARAEVEAMQAAETRRADPAMRTEYAAHAAGIDLPDATRLTRAIRGEMDPNPQGAEDATGNLYGDVPVARPNLPAGSERVFRSALASTMANLLATGKTNAAQLAQAGDRVNETALTNEAANTTNLPTANRLIAAVAGKVREPFRVSPQGVVLNEETGAANEGTQLAQAVRALSGARTATEGSKQTELGTRSTRNTASAELAGARRAAVERGETGRGGQRVTPQQVERWVSEVARKEWDTIPPRERKGMNYDQHLEKVRGRFKPTATGQGGIEQDIQDALAAINSGAPSKAVHARFEKRWGKKLTEVAPKPAVAVPADDDTDEEED